MPNKKLPFKKFRWTPELAYTIGLLTTDGNLSPDGRHFTMRSCDKALLKTFASCLKINNKISKSLNNGYGKRPCYRLQFGNVQLYRWLNSIGLTPAKSLTIGSLKIPPKFFRDFLRGHLDGDGSIFSYTDKYNVYKGKTYTNTRIYTKFISASEMHIKWLYSMLSKYSPSRGVVLKKQTKRNTTMWEIKMAKYESLKLFPWLYYKENLPSLKRKRLLAEGFLKRMIDNKLIN